MDTSASLHPDIGFHTKVLFSCLWSTLDSSGAHRACSFGSNGKICTYCEHAELTSGKEITKVFHVCHKFHPLFLSIVSLGEDLIDWQAVLKQGQEL